MHPVTYIYTTQPSVAVQPCPPSPDPGETFSLPVGAAVGHVAAILPLSRSLPWRVSSRHDGRTAWSAHL